MFAEPLLYKLISGKRAVIGYADGSLKVFDLKSGTAGSLEPHEMQASQILSIAVHYDNNLVAAGDADGKVILIKTQPVKVSICQLYKINIVKTIILNC